MQRVRASCVKPPDVLVLPFDLMASSDKLQAAAKAADEAFGGAGVDYLIHNAGEEGSLQGMCDDAVIDCDVRAGLFLVL